MKKLPGITTLGLLITIMSACSKQLPVNDRPAWIDDPGDNFVGKCGTHIRGPIAQEKCAFEKGLAFIAMSKGVSVDLTSSMTIKQTSTENTGSSYGKMKAVIEMDEKDIRVKGTIIDKWYNRAADILYVLIRED